MRSHTRYILFVIAIVVTNLLSSTPVRSAEHTLVTGNDREDLEYLISPDRQYALFRRHLIDTDATTLELVPLDGSQPTSLRTSLSGISLRILGWTGDSRSVLVLETGPTNISLLHISIDGSQAVIVGDQLSYACGNGGCGYPAYLGEAPDGALLYTSVLKVDETIVTNFFRTPRTSDFRSTVQIGSITSQTASGVGGCRLTPNAQNFICIMDTQMVLMDTSGATAPRLRTLPSDASLIGITPDSRWLITKVYTYYTGGAFGELYAIPLDREALPVRLSEEPVDSLGPVVTPDGRSILFVKDRYTEVGPYGIYRARPDGGIDSAELLVDIPRDFNLWVGNLLITADGQYLVYTLANTDQSPTPPPHPAIGIYSLALNQPGAQPVKLASFGADEMLEYNQSFAKHDQALVYQVTNQVTELSRIVSVPVAGPASAAIPVRTDGMDERISLQATFGSYALLSSTTVITTGLLTQKELFLGTTFISDLDGVHPPRQVGSSGPFLDNSLSLSLGDGRFLLRQRLYKNPNIYEYDYQDSYSTADLGVLHGGFTTEALCVAEGDGQVVIPVTLEGAPISTRTITYTVSGGTAGAADTTLPISGTIAFESGQRQASLSIPVVEDALTEGSETLLLSLTSDPESITLDRAAFTLTLRDQGSCQAQLPLIVNGS